MTEWKKNSKFFIYVKGKPVVLNKIAISDLGIILRRFQELYNKIGEIISPNFKEKDLILFLNPGFFPESALL